MSELSLNVTPSPKLLNAAAGNAGPQRATGSAAGAPGRPGASAGGAEVAANPFAALLSGVLESTQPAPAATVSAAPGDPLRDLLTQPDTAANPAGIASLPGIAAPLPAPVADPATPPDGNLLPYTGKILPAELASASTPPSGSLQEPATTPEPAASAAPAANSRPRISLADLALNRPLEPPSELAVATPGDGAREAAASTLAGRSLTAARPAGEAPPRAMDLYMAPTASLPPGTDIPTLASTDSVALRLSANEFVRGTSLPGSGTEFLAGQLAAFAASNDSGSSALSGTATVTATSAADGGSAALLGRLGSTGLPPLQPLGDTGAFAGGLADRLLTLGGPGAHTARLKLHPEHLGELDVEITMEDGTAQVWFGTTSGQARDAIEGSLPRLRELFAEQGIQLTRTQIDAGSGQMGNPGSDQQRRTAAGFAAWNEHPAWQSLRPAASAAAASGLVASSSPRLLDVWA